MMDEYYWQLIAVAVVVLGSATWLVRQFIRRGCHSPCAGGCTACPHAEQRTAVIVPLQIPESHREPLAEDSAADVASTTEARAVLPSGAVLWPDQSPGPSTPFRDGT